MISLDNSNIRCNVIEDLPTETCVSSETKDVTFKAFNIIATINDVKSLVKHISCDFKYKVDSTTCNSNQKWDNNKYQYECKMYLMCQKDYSWNPSTCVFGISTYLETIVDDSIIVCDEIIKVVHNAHVTNNVSANVTCTVSIKSDN